MSYIVFARKWRPQTFDEVVGQEHVTTTLKNSLAAGRTAHAYLFAGPRGVGKTSTARIFSKALNCEKGPTPSPCLKCVSCQEIAAGKSLDILEIDGASNRGIDEIRNLRSNIGFAPASGRYKIYIIDEVHMLTTEAFNALLKTLEEPPVHVKFIFATTQPHKVLPTILSRCQRFDFRRVTINELITKLKGIASQEKIKISQEALLNIARAADGSMRDAESILDQLVSFCEGKIEAQDVAAMLGLVSQDIFGQLTQSIIKRDSPAALKIVDTLINEGKDISQFLSGLIEHFRNIMIAKVSPQPEALIDLPSVRVKKIIEFSREFSFEEIFLILNILSQAEYNIKHSNRIRTPLELAIIKLTRLNSLASIPEMLSQLSRLEEKIKGIVPESVSSGSTRPNLRCIKSTSPDVKTKTSNIIPATSKQKTTGKTSSTLAVESTSTQTELTTLEDINKHWAEILQALSRKSPSCSAYLSAGQPVKYDQGLLTIGFGQQNGLHKETLEDLKNRQLLHDVLKQVLGIDIRTTFITVDNDSAGEALTTTVSSKATAKVTKSKSAVSKHEEIDAEEIEPIVKAAAKIFKGRPIKV